MRVMKVRECLHTSQYIANQSHNVMKFVNGYFLPLQYLMCQRKKKLIVYFFNFLQLDTHIFLKADFSSRWKKKVYIFRFQYLYQYYNIKMYYQTTYTTNKWIKYFSTFYNKFLPFNIQQKKESIISIHLKSLKF